MGFGAVAPERISSIIASTCPFTKRSSSASWAGGGEIANQPVRAGREGQVLRLFLIRFHRVQDRFVVQKQPLAAQILLPFGIACAGSSPGLSLTMSHRPGT